MQQLIAYPLIVEDGIRLKEHSIIIIFTYQNLTEMKVICIDANFIGNKGMIKPPAPLIEGDIYTVFRECMSQNQDGELIPAYELNEMLGGGWERFRFIPLSSISETEFKRSYNTEKV